MNKYIKYALIIVFVGILCIVLIGWLTPTIICRYPAPISPINTTVGSVFMIKMTSNPTTGYTWNIESIDKSILKVINKDYKQSNSGLIGAGGTEIWQIKALKTGQTSISFGYMRPWEGKEALKRAVYRVYIR